MRDLEPHELDHTLRTTAREFELSGSIGPDGQSTLPERLADDETLAWLREARGKDPLAESLERWLLRLREHAECAPRRRKLGEALNTTLHPVREPESGLRTLGDLLRTALARPAERAALLRSFFGAAGGLSEQVKRLWEERAQFAERVGASLASFEVASPAVLPAARDFLSQTRDAYQTLGIDGGERLLTLALAEDAHEGWPSRLSSRSVAALLPEPEWFEGLRLAPFSLPEAHGAASFARAFGAVGRALADAAAARRTPFVMTRDVFDAQRENMGALLSLLPTSRAFATRRLGLGAGSATDHVRSLSRTALVSARTAAFRVLLRELLLGGSRSLQQNFGELAELAFGFELPLPVAGAFIRARPRDTQRFAALLQASRTTSALIERHDEDWFRNPRAIRELRAELEQPLPPGPDAEALSAGGRALQAGLEAKL